MTTYTVAVREYELDSFGHVNNAVYLNYVEAAKWDFFNKTGIIDEIRKNNIFPVIMENNIRYLRELKSGDVVNITTRWKCSGRILHFYHVLFNKTSDQISAKVHGKIMFVDYNRVMCDIPECMKKYLELYNNDN